MLKSFKKYGLLAITVPLLTGCVDQVAGLGIGSLFSGGTSGAIALAGAPAPALNPDLLAAAGHNPEPASMFLLGSGMATMAYFKRKKNGKIK